MTFEKHSMRSIEYLKRLSYNKEWTKTTHTYTKKKTKSPDNCLPYFGAIKKYARDRILYVNNHLFWHVVLLWCRSVFVCARDDDDDDDNDDNSVK